MARGRRCCQCEAMASDRKNPVAGGVLLALSLLVGAVTGLVYRQPSIGLVAGLGVGLLLLALVWLLNRR